jgi:acyl-CoA dehydrogenase
MIRMQDTLKLPSVGLSGFEPPLTEDERAIQDTVHRFAKDVLRPVGRELDRMTSEAATAIELESLRGEKMGWGDGGLGVSLGAATFPLAMALAAGNQELAEICAGRIGCWLITQPDRGSDVQVLYSEDWPANVPGNKGNVTARVTDSEFILNGQSSAWVSSGAVAQVALCYIVADYGDGFYGKDGLPNGLACTAPQGRKGVSRGRKRIMTGKSSTLLSVLSRLMPTNYGLVLKQIGL